MKGDGRGFHMTCVIYTCHNVVPLADGTEERGTIDLNAFKNQLRWIKRCGIRFISMRDLRGWLAGDRQIPGRSAVLTFDDALISVAEHAFPYLKQQSIPITVFVIAGLIGRESQFSTHSSAPRRRHLNHGQLKMLLETGLVEIGAHGYRHLNLTRIDHSELQREIFDAKKLLEDTLGVDVPYFAYPWGNTTAAVTDAVKAAGYRLAFSTRKRKLTGTDIDPFRIPRVNWGRRATVFKLAKYYLLPWFRTEKQMTEDR
jgi:peptidoglycan/xylan/chitin deacetylase (PgdA/CDA1 family)